MSWELERLQSEWKEKELRCGNIREQYEEQGKSEKQLRLEEQCRALEIAEERMQKAARVTGASMDRRVSRRASEIFSAVTDGRYHSVEISRQKGHYRVGRRQTYSCGASEPGDDRADLFLCQDGSGRDTGRGACSNNT